MNSIIMNIVQSWNPWIILLIFWSLPWKGVALWKAAQRKDVWWFVALFIVNTFGALEILYIFIWSKRRDSVTPPDRPVMHDDMFQK